MFCGVLTSCCGITVSSPQPRIYVDDRFAAPCSMPLLTAVTESTADDNSISRCRRGFRGFHPSAFISFSIHFAWICPVSVLIRNITLHLHSMHAVEHIQSADPTYSRPMYSCC